MERVEASDPEFRGELTVNDSFDRLGKLNRRKVHEVRLFAGRHYRIDLTGSFDTYLRVEDSAMRQLASDDDGGEGRNSRLLFVAPQTATYRIVVTSDAPAIGTYRLAIVLEQ